MLHSALAQALSLDTVDKLPEFVPAMQALYTLCDLEHVAVGLQPHLIEGG